MVYRMCVYLELKSDSVRINEVGKGDLPLHPTNSRRSLVNAVSSGLSCMLFPFFPRSPHLKGRPSSSPSSFSPEEVLNGFPLRIPISPRGVDGREPPILGLKGVVPPPRIDETDECAQLACLRMADITVMTSVVMSATASTAITVLRGAMIAPFVYGKSMLAISREGKDGDV